MAFKVDDEVFWESQAAGVKRRKEGKVIEVVPPRAKPKTMPSRVGGTRDHESYVVRAKAIGTQLERAKRYWPLVSTLHQAPVKEMCEVVGIDFAREGAEETAVVYHITDQGTGTVRVVSKEEFEEYEKFGQKMVETDGSFITSHTIGQGEPGPDGKPVVEIERIEPTSESKLYDPMDPTDGLTPVKED